MMTNQKASGTACFWFYLLPLLLKLLRDQASTSGTELIGMHMSPSYKLSPPEHSINWIGWKLNHSTSRVLGYLIWWMLIRLCEVLALGKLIKTQKNIQSCSVFFITVSYVLLPQETKLMIGIEKQLYIWHLQESKLWIMMFVCTVGIRVPFPHALRKIPLKAALGYDCIALFHGSRFTLQTSVEINTLSEQFWMSSCTIPSCLTSPALHWMVTGLDEPLWPI